MSEISTRAERLGEVPNGIPEPAMTMTLGQVESLLRAATEYAKANRPVVLHTAPMPVPAVTVLPTAAGYAPPRHPGLDIAVPAASVGWAPVRHRAPQRPGWGVRFAVVSMLVSLAGGASAGATDGNSAAVAFCALGIAGVVGGVARAVTEQEA